jgi:hypothetical protein
MRQARLLAFAALPAATAAHAVGEQVFLILQLDIVLFIIATAVIVFALRCPAWIRVGLACVYLASLVALFFLPMQLFPPLGALNAPLHFAFPGLVTAAAFLAWRGTR